MSRIGTRTRLLALLLAAGTLAMLSCSRTLGPDYLQPVRLQSVLEPRGLSSALGAVVLTVSAEDFEAVVDTLEAAQGRVETTVDVPPGFDRVFRLDAYDTSDLLLFSGADTVDVSLGENQTVEIRLQPRALMLKVDPLYQELPEGGSGYFDVFVYNVDSLFGAAFRVAVNTEIIALDSARSGTLTAEWPIFFVHRQEDYIAVATTLTRGQAPVSGFGHLARIYYHPVSAGASELQFDAATAQLSDPNGNLVKNSDHLALAGGQIVITPVSGR